MRGARKSGSDPAFYRFLEAKAAADDHRVRRGELHAVHVLVDRQLQEAVELKALGDLVAHAGADEDGGAAGVVGLGLVAAVSPAPERVRLQHEAPALAYAVAQAGVERDA